MKKLLLTIITLSIITFTGCYDPDTATVRINLGNMPIAKHEPKSLIDRVLGLFEKEAQAQYTAEMYVHKIHLAAFSGNGLSTSMTIDASDVAVTYVMVSDQSTVELTVPAGDNITIAVIGEDINGAITHYGQNNTPINIKAGSVETVNIQVLTFDSLIASNYFNFHYEGEAVNYNAILAWNRIYGATDYSIEYNTFQIEENYLPIYSGSDNSCLNTYYDSANSNQYRIRIKFGFTGSESNQISFSF
ncbi:MAG TPA: hypothetical protein PK514_07230 [Spirochaetota bacterium]|nr:hypothetical protein [Spirochaetota bacterium]